MKNTADWFNAEVWKLKTQHEAHQSIDKKQFQNQYNSNSHLWDAAFDFLKQDLTTLEPGKFEIMGEDVFAMISDYQTKVKETTKWEAHRKYIDLQIVISGEELMGIAPLQSTTEPEKYHNQKDLIFFNDAQGQFYEAKPGTFFLFFPSDAHMPGLQLNSSSPVRKLVIKIAVSE